MPSYKSTHTMPRLHYLYEQQGRGRERFVYYCSSCDCVLKIRRDFGLAHEMVGSSSGRCLGCGRLLEGNIECRLAPAPEEWSDAFLNTISTTEEKAPVFLSASSLPHFSLGFPRLDSLLRPFDHGRLVVLSGRASTEVAELAVFRAQLPVDMGGLDSAVLFIDGGNRSDPYLFSSFAKQRRLKPAVAMRRVTTCRVFTFYQLASLVSEYLVRAVEDYGTKLVVIADLLGTFNEPELEEREARRVLKAVEEGISRTKKNALVIATLAAPNKYDETVAEWADVMVGLSSSGGTVQANLLKHKNRLPASSSFKLNHLLKAPSSGVTR
jgi:hypothetical protein